MPDGELRAVVGFIHGLVDPDLASQTDNELLRRFLANRDESAFEVLVRRHGPMVLGLCRRILRDPQNAEDAFQAAFLVFVRKAASIARPELLGNWLYGVASRTARAARAAAEKRRVKEAEAVPREQPAQEGLWQELQPYLDRELNRLPAKYRIPLVLCYLEEKSRQEAARALGLPEGTLSSRLARGRALLAQRLTRWCPSVAGEVLLAGLGKQAMAAPLVQATTRAGMAVLAGQPINAGLVSAQVALLSQGVLRSLSMTKFEIAAVFLCMLGLLACAVGTATSLGSSTKEDSPAAVVVGPSSPNDPLMTQVLEATKNITDAQVKLRVLLRIASVQHRTGNAAGAQKTRHEALELARGFAAGSPRVDGLLMVARSQIEAKDRGAVFETLKQAEEAVTAIESENEKLNCRARLVIAQATAGDYEGGLRTLAKGGNFQGDLLSGFGYELNTENKEAARKAVTQALALVKFEGENAAIQRSNGLAGACFALARCGALEQALETAAKMGKERDRCLQVIVVAQAGDGDIAGAARTAKSIQQDDIKAHALDAIIDAQVKAGDLTAARSTLEEVRKLVEKFQQAEMEQQRKMGGFKQQQAPNPRLAQLQTAIALSQLLLGDMNGALLTVANMESDLEKAYVLMRLGTDRMKAGKPAEAREMLLAAAQAAQRVILGKAKGGWPTKSEKATTLSMIARAQAKAGDVKEAFRTANTIPTDQAMDDALAGIAPAQAEAGDLKGALETVARIRDETSKGAALEELAQVLVRAGHEKDALDLAAQQTSPAAKARALLGVILAKTKAKLPKESPK
jgi:RNA polymerase sigma factor (sigma-70 family)